MTRIVGIHKPKAEIEFRETLGLGSGNTAVPYYSAVFKNTGTAYSYINNATDGCLITILESGTYEVGGIFVSAVGPVTLDFAISRNASASELDTFNISTSTNRIIYERIFAATGANGVNHASHEIYLEAGDVIAQHYEASTFAAHAIGTFYISRVSAF